MEAQTIAGANALVSPTWHRLKMNDADIALPALEPYPNGITVSGDAPSAAEGSFDALACLEHGMGAQADEWLRVAAGSTLLVATRQGEQRQQPVIVQVDGRDGCASVAAIDVVAAEGSSVSVTIALHAPNAGRGAVGCTVRVWAKPHSHVTLASVQTAGNGFTALDNTALQVDEGARVDVSHTVLGGQRAYVGLAGNLEGARGSINVTTRYAACADHLQDFNYLIRHRGQKTTSKLVANGVLTGNSKKTLRGTIDLMKGCKGADGYESETVLLADEGVDNKSIPIILCAEDDVAGNHGATIGHLRPEQLNYLQSRGIAPAAAELLFASATFEEAALQAADERIRQNIKEAAHANGVPFQEDVA